MSDLKNPIVIVPGIKGTGIENFYPLDPTSTWSTLQAVAGTSLQQALLNASGDADFADEVTNRPTQIFKMAYGKLVDGLCGRLNVPVYVFPYDWRLSNEVNGKHLVVFVETIRRKPMNSIKGWSKEGAPKLVNLVVHSMGGLVAKAAIKEWVDVRGFTPPPIDSLVFVATPHLGSLDAVRAMISGDSPILDFQKELRKLARALPGAYELLPRLGNAVTKDGQELNIFEVESWQSNVTQVTDGLEDVTEARLTKAKTFLDGLPDLTQKPYKPHGGVLCIVGNKQNSTLRRIPVIAKVTDPGGKVITNWYDFTNAEKGDGDQVVPVDSAILDGAKVVVIPDSAADWWPSELFAKGNLHAFICTLDETQTIIAGFLKNPNGKENDWLPLNMKTWTLGN